MEFIVRNARSTKHETKIHVKDQTWGRPLAKERRNTKLSLCTRLKKYLKAATKYIFSYLEKNSALHLASTDSKNFGGIL